MDKDIDDKLREVCSIHEAEWAAAMDTSDDCIYILDSDRRLIRANKTFFRMTRTTPEEAIGRHIADIVHPDGEAVPCPVCRAQEEKRDAVIIMEADHPDNPVGVPIEITVKVIRDERGEPRRIFMSLHDLTEGRRLVEEKRMLEEQLAQAQKMESIGRLAGGIAHDFNNILTTILGYSELLLFDIPTDAPRREQVESIHAAAERASALTRQLLAFSRKQILEVKPISLNRTIGAILKIIAKMLGEDITVETRFEAENDVIEADCSQIEQVMMNLAVNARDAMPGGGRLVIETRETDLDESYVRKHPEVSPGPHVMLAVSDSGEGMAREVRERIFDPFFTTKEQGKGTGLGLATVHGIVKQHGGHIFVYSEPGAGTTFKIFFPLSRKPEARDEKKRAAMPRGEATILVVDDEDSVRDFITDTLEPLGYRCLSASCGREALEVAAAAEREIHLLLTDVVMPGMNGRELADALCAGRSGIRVIFMSGYTENTITADGVLKDGTNYLAKPLSPGVLAEKVHQVLKGDRSANGG